MHQDGQSPSAIKITKAAGMVVLMHHAQMNCDVVRDLVVIVSTPNLRMKRLFSGST